MDWDGKLGGGGTATSGAYSLKVVADGALGVTSVGAAADRRSGRAQGDGAGDRVGGAYRKTAKLAYTVRDAFSAVGEGERHDHGRQGPDVATVPLRLGQAGREPHLRLEAEGTPDLHGDVPGDGPRRQPRGGAAVTTLRVR